MKPNAEISKKHRAGVGKLLNTLAGLMEQHEKMAWMLRVLLEGKN